MGDVVHLTLSVCGLKNSMRSFLVLMNQEDLIETIIKTLWSKGAISGICNKPKNKPFNIQYGRKAKKTKPMKQPTKAHTERAENLAFTWNLKEDFVRMGSLRIHLCWPFQHCRGIFFCTRTQLSQSLMWLWSGPNNTLSTGQGPFPTDYLHTGTLSWWLTRV